MQPDSAAPPSWPLSLQRALRHLAVVFALVGGTLGLTYLLPGLRAFRPWLPGDALPLSSLWRSWQPRPQAPGGGQPAGEALDGMLKQHLVAEPSSPALPSSVSPAPAAQLLAVPAPQEYEGIRIFIEDESGRGMAPFYAKLKQTAAQQASAITRIAHYGDSSIATDHITSTLRRRLQQRFGDAGHGFVLVAATYLPYRHRDIDHQANDAWSLLPIMNRADPLGRYGYGGVQVRSKSGAWATFGDDPEAPVGNRLSRFEVWLQRYERGGTLSLRIDGGEPRLLPTAASTSEDAVERIELSDGRHKLELRHGGGNAVRLYGVVLERSGPGVVYDSLGLVGARAVRLLNYDAPHITAQLRRRQTDLLVLGFGGNEAGDPLSSLERYEEGYVQVIERMRAARPELGCLLFAPLDQGHIDERGRVVTMPTVPRIVEAQRRAAKRQGCAFYDTFQAMGGKEAMRRWVEGRPRLALGDLRHATPTGYELIGTLFYKALLKGFADYLAQPAAAAVPTPAAIPATPRPSPTK